MLKEVKIELTNKCSRNCKHCSGNATSDSNKLRSLDYQDVARIIKEASQMGVETIVFTGGEPLMYDALDKLIKLTTDLKMKSTIYTLSLGFLHYVEIHIIYNKINYSTYEYNDWLIGSGAIESYNKK